MKKLLLILGLLALSSTNAFATDGQSMNRVMADVETIGSSGFQLIEVDSSKISRENQSTAQEENSNITKLGSQIPSFVTAFAPPDRGSPPTRGEGGKEGGATR